MTHDDERDPDLDRPRIPPPRRPAYESAVPPRDHPQATTVLVLGILGIVLCGFIAPFAWHMGNNALREIDANPTVWGGRSMVNAGRVCGIVGTILLVISCCLVGGLVLLGGSSGSSSGY